MIFYLTGKRRCLRDAGHILRIMSDLLGHENQEVIVLNDNIGIKCIYTSKLFFSYVTITVLHKWGANETLMPTQMVLIAFILMCPKIRTGH